MRRRESTDTFLFISHTTNVLLFKSRCNIFIGFRVIKEMPGLVGSGTPCIIFHTFPNTSQVTVTVKVRASAIMVAVYESGKQKSSHSMLSFAIYFQRTKFHLPHDIFTEHNIDARCNYVNTLRRSNEKVIQYLYRPLHLTFMEPCIARCVFYITNEMQLI